MSARDIVAAVEHWSGQGKRAVFVRPVSLHGFGSRRAGELMAVSETGEQVGAVLGGSADNAIEREARQLLNRGPDHYSILLDIAVDGSAAVLAGLACGGKAQLLLQTTDTMPVNVWPLLKAEQPVALASTLERQVNCEQLLVSADGPQGSLGTKTLDEIATREAQDMIARGYAGSRIVEGPDVRLLVEAFLPVTQLLVLGAATLADAIVQQANLLGWQGWLIDDGSAAQEAVSLLRPADGLVAIGHASAFDTAIVKALKSHVSYVGTLGSREMLGKRRERLKTLGASEAEVARMYAPVGLDIGARTPEETAVAICAEILVNRSGRAATHLRDQTGPINS